MTDCIQCSFIVHSMCILYAFIVSQYNFYLFRLPSSVPKAIMQYDTGLWPMEWRIKYKKLNFVRGIIYVETIFKYYQKDSLPGIPQ